MNGRLSLKNQSRGFTLVELMVSTVISLVILGGVVQSVVTSKTTYVLQEELARMQEKLSLRLRYSRLGYSHGWLQRLWGQRQDH